MFIPPPCQLCDPIEVGSHTPGGNASLPFVGGAGFSRFRCIERMVAVRRQQRGGIIRRFRWLRADGCPLPARCDSPSGHDPCSRAWNLCLSLFVEPTIGVGHRLMGVVLALLSFEIDLGIVVAAFRWILILLVLGAKALHRGPGFDQSTVNRKVLFGQQAE